MSSTILVAEDDAFMRTLIRDILVAGGYHVETASGLASASALMARKEPDVLFASLDLMREGECDLLDEARRLGFQVPLVLLVDAAIENPVATVRESRAFGYLAKPVDRFRLEMLARQGVAAKELLVRDAGRVDEIARVHTLVRAVLETDDGAFFILDEEGLIVDCGGLIEILINPIEKPVAGCDYLSILPELIAIRQAGTLSEVRATMKAVCIEEKRGGVVVESCIKPVVEGGALTGFVVAVRDVTAKRWSETGLAAAEKQYRSVFEGATDAILLIDKESGKVLDCNGASVRMLGFEADAMCGRNIRTMVDHPEQTMKAMKTGVKRISYEYLRRKDGSSFPVELSLSYYTNGGREVCVMSGQDISRHKMVEEALREGARLYRAVVEDQTELICRFKADGTLSFINGAYARFFGEDEDEAIGSNVFAHHAPSDRQAVMHWLETANPDQPVLDKEIPLTRHDGEVRWIHWTNRAVFNDREAVIKVQAVGRDVTERKQAEKALSRATQEKEQYRLNLVATFKSIPDAILTVDSNLTIMASNGAAASLFNFDKGRMRGLNLEDLVEGDGNPCVGVLKQVLKTDKPVRGYEIELELKDLGERMLEINCSPLVDQGRQHNGAVLVVRDVSHVADLEKQLQQRQGFRGIIGRSSSMQDIYQLLEQLSSLDSIVLILGESGTGKELAAEALHYGGARAGKPLVKVNCSALSESLLESELFGHVRGAFTGAVRDKVGRIQAAQGGTLFLDEIGDISPLLQLKLLRFLEQKEYERVGESKTYSADVRILAATNVDLLESVKQGVFREDLYYRLNVMPVTLPPLRERQADIPLLVEHFLDVFSDHFGKSFEGVSQEVMDLFMGYSWPGNIRELRHALEHACILAPGKIVGLKHIRKDLIENTMNHSPSLPETLPRYFPVTVAPCKPGKEDVLAAIQQNSGNKVRAARQLGIHRATLYRKLKMWGIDI
nr:sigma 54-interacting transcriptional regulator [uncultured Pseudodesulfovibrio sp.]